MKYVVENEFQREQANLKTLSTQSQDSISTLATQTRNELQSFHAGIATELAETRSSMTNLRQEASDALQALARNVSQARAEQQNLKNEAERVVMELRGQITQARTAHTTANQPSLPSPLGGPPGPSGITAASIGGLSSGGATGISLGACAATTGVPADTRGGGQAQPEEPPAPPPGIPHWGNGPGQCQDA